MNIETDKGILAIKTDYPSCKKFIRTSHIVSVCETDSIYFITNKENIFFYASGNYLYAEYSLTPQDLSLDQPKPTISDDNIKTYTPQSLAYEKN